MAHIISNPPEPVTIRVRDIDVRFAGETASFTLRPEDELMEYDNSIELHFGGYGNGGEVVRINRAQVLWISTRNRVMKVIDKDSQDAPHRRN